MRIYCFAAQTSRSPLARQMISDLNRRIRPTYRRQATDLAERLGIV